MSGKIFLLFCFFLFSLSVLPLQAFSQLPSQSGVYLSTDKNNYDLNEIVKIIIYPPIYPDYSLSIITPSNIYNYLGIPSETLTYRPQEEGEHFIELYNQTNSLILEKKNFKVMKNNPYGSQDNINDNLGLEILDKTYISTISTDKAEYRPNEIVVISFNVSDLEYTVKITDGEKNYYYDKPRAPLIFSLKTAGLFEVFLLDKNNSEIAETQFLSILPKKKFNILDSKGKNIAGDMKFYSNNKLIASKKIQELQNESFFENKTYDVELFPDIRGVEKIRFRNLKIRKEIDLGIEDVSSGKGFVKSYAVDPTRLEFSDAVITSIAQGNALYKCKDWNFSKQECYGQWSKIMDLTPGQEYTVLLTNSDPGYGETGSVPEPHTVKGYIYYTNNMTRVDNGIPVRIINRANGASVLTQVYAPPVPLYKGAYSANIYGITGDSIVVRAWNLTHYGETNSTLAAASTDVNVSFQFSRGSETNVSILYPLNNTAFNITKTFNVTADVEVIGGGNGIECYATLSFTKNIGQLFSGETSTLYLGNLNLYNSVRISWNLTGTNGDTSNISVNASCSTDTVLENLNRVNANNITVLDQINPEITLFSPINNSEVTNPVMILFNVSDHTGVENCSLYLNSALNQTLFNPEMYILHSFTLTLQANTYIWKIKCYDNSTYHNYNETDIRFFYLPSWQFYFGNMTSKIALENSGNNEQFTWEDQVSANIYVVETGTTLDWGNLQALGRDRDNISAFNDFHEADLNLSLDLFSDSINNTFTINEMPKSTIDMTIYNRNIKNIPIVNSTNTSNFITGILWDMGIDATEYNGSQPLIFFTNKSIAMPGKYGGYEYEIRIPATLKNYKMESGTVSFYIEII